MFEGSVVLVTGAGAGLGRELCIRFGRAGAEVIGVDLRSERLGELDEVARAEGWTLTQQVVDLGNPEDVADAVTGVVGRYRPVDVLVNNAAIGDGWRPVAEIDDELLRRVLEVNLVAPFVLCRELLPSMLERQRGVIINIASIAAWKGYNSGASYSMSKAGLVALTKSIACAYGASGLRSVAVCPGGMETRIREGVSFSTTGKELMERQAGTRPPIDSPENVAEVVTFLASERASSMNGAVVAVDRGWSAW